MVVLRLNCKAEVSELLERALVPHCVYGISIDSHLVPHGKLYKLPGWSILMAHGYVHRVCALPSSCLSWRHSYGQLR